MTRYFVVYSNADMPRRRVHLQPHENELVYGFIHADETYVKRMIRERHLEDHIICQFMISETINQERLDRLFVDTAITFRRGPYNRFFVQADHVDEFVDEFTQSWINTMPQRDADALVEISGRVRAR